ncbi:MAG: NAD(P)-dependent oxidoreductase [Pseudomonadota bacterium]
MQQELGVGFIGLGVMGEPMCRHILQKRAGGQVSQVWGFDLSSGPVLRLKDHGLKAVSSAQEAAERADLVLLSLPGDEQLEALCRGSEGLLSHIRPGQTVVDLGTSSLRLTRALQAEFAACGAAYADAPVARTRSAAEAGTLAVLVGGDEAVFQKISPVLACFAEDVIHCGATGAGQVVKQMNNMVLFQTVTALAEALSIAKCSGVEAETLFAAMGKGSGNSFALQNHGANALLPGHFPKQAFSTSYALKDLTYAIELAQEAGVATPGAAATRRLFEQAIEAGFGDDYFPTVIKMLEEKT